MEIDGHEIDERVYELFGFQESDHGMRDPDLGGTDAPDTVRPGPANTPCSVCPEHRGGAPTVIGEHEFALDTDEAISNEDEVFPVWSWLCGCGARGRWQSQSEAAAYHGWLKHCGVPQGYAGEG